MLSRLRDATAATSPPEPRATRIAENATPVGTATHQRFGLTDISLVLMALIWGVNFSVVKWGAATIAPLSYNAVRVALAALSLVLVAQLWSWRAGPVASGWPSTRDALALVGLGTLGNGLYQIFFIEGLARTRASDAALVIASTPAFIALLGRMRGTERIAPRAVAGITLSILGIALVVLGSSHAGAAKQASLAGDLLILAGCVCWAVFTILLQPYTHRVSGLHLSALTMAGGLIPLAVVALPSLAATTWTRVPLSAWGAIAYSGFGALVLAYLFWYRGVRVLGPTRTAMYSNLQPVFAVIVAWLSLGETPTSWQGAGAAAIITGLLLTRA
jgi:drug/metabolite transporter (DMT)-like permease